MRLYLIRHAKAERDAPDGRDASRALTKRGVRQAAWLAERLARAEARPGRVMASPAVRALQTARVIADALGLPVEPHDALGLDAAPSDVIGLLGAIEAAECVALVGHNPTFSLAADVLLRGIAGEGSTELRTGEAAVLDIPDPTAAPGAATLLCALRMPQ
ncbi:MAG TPA: histidine phosphatase family protein [Phycisphaerales bacterium]|nr:histidine phosphatase family protein [Phycisphaerales bacterium]